MATSLAIRHEPLEVLKQSFPPGESARFDEGEGLPGELQVALRGHRQKRAKIRRILRPARDHRENLQCYQMANPRNGTPFKVILTPNTPM